jgi:hypothetical protein
MVFAMALTMLAGCVPPQVVSRPTLHEARLGQGQLVADTSLRPGELRAEIIEIQPAKTEIHVRADDNRTRVLGYDPVGTRVLYHGREYPVEELQAGDVIAFRPQPRRNIDYVDTVRLQEPVQARAGSTIARRVPPPSRPEVIEGTVESIDHDRGVFEVRPRNGGLITVALPYNARTSEVDVFRRLRRGDWVRVEGEFINRDNFQLLAFSR